MPPIETKILLGWFEREAAIQFLTTECVTDPQITNAEAEAIWQTYRDRVQALPDRAHAVPVEYTLSKAERKHKKEFSRGARLMDHQFDRIAKIDLMDLAVHQLMVLTGRCESKYADEVANDGRWRKLCLRLRPAIIPVVIRSQTATSVVWDIPHAEFEGAGIVLPNGQKQLSPREFPAWVTVVPCDGRWMLWAGYHRSYARIAYTNAGDPDGSVDRAAPVVLVENVTGRRFAVEALARATGSCPPLFRDFFNETLFFTVQLRRKRYELRATINGNAFNWSVHHINE